MESQWINTGIGMGYIEELSDFEHVTVAGVISVEV